MKRIRYSTLLWGFIFILIGVVLLFRRLDIWTLSWNELYPIGLMALGVFAFVKVAQGDKNASFWGTFFLSIGILTFLRNYLIFDALWALEFWTIGLLALGLGFFVLYGIKPGDWGVLIPGSILIFLGLVSLLDDLDVPWFTIEAVKDYWPAILIVVGVGIIISSLMKRPPAAVKKSE